MKNITFKPFLIIFLFLALSNSYSFSQNVKASISNRVFLLCDEYGSPMKVNGSGMFLVLHENKGVNLLMGKDISSAVDAGSLMSGSWYSSGTKVTWTWTKSGKSKSAYYNSSTKNMKTADGKVFKNVGKF